MAEETASAGLPRPEIEDDGGSVTVCFRHRRAVASADGRRGATKRGADAPAGKQVMEQLDDRLQAILALLEREGHPLALREIRAGLAERVDERRLREDLAGLKAKGLIAPAGHGRGARWTRL